MLDFVQTAVNWIARIANGLTLKTERTGVNNMKDPEFLSKVQDTVWNDPRWRATPGVTHCNQAALAVAQGVGCHEFDPPTGGEPYTADQLFLFFQRDSSNFFEKNLEDVQALVNAGSLVFAILPSWILLEAHGHIVSLTPGIPVHSEGIDKDVPVCLNISTAELSSRCVGINFAFPLKRAMPRYFAWKVSL